MVGFMQSIREEVTRYPDGAGYMLYSIDDAFSVDKQDLVDIARICNEKLIYRFIFKDRLGGRPYTVQDSREFITWAKTCWQKEAHYFFFVRSPQSAIVACLDLTPDRYNKVMLGYWASEKTPGLMTNTVTLLAQVAGRAGYRGIYAFVDPVNVRSEGVVKRAGFAKTGMHIVQLDFLGKKLNKHQQFVRYDKTLESPAGC